MNAFVSIRAVATTVLCSNRTMSNRSNIPYHLRPWRSWYQLGIWRRRREAHLRIEPLCRFCLQSGLVVPAEIADHIEHHRGDWNKFLTSELQSLCKRCHNSTKHRLEVRGYNVDVGEDGYPIDPRHPRYQNDDIKIETS